MLRNERLDFLQRVLTGEGVWVVPVREEHHARIHAFPKDEADGADGGMQAGFVTIVHDGDVLGELADEPDLLLRERGTAGGHHVGDAHLVHHHNVHVALYQDASVCLGNFALGEVNAQQVTALDVNFRFRGVDVLGRVVCLERTAAVGNDASAHGVDGEHDPLAEFVHQRTVILLDGQAGGNQIFVFIPGCAGGIHQGGFPRGRPAQAPLPDGGVLNTAVPVIAVSHGLAFRALQLVREELAGKLAHGHEALAALAGGDLLGALFLFLHLYIILPGQVAQGFRVGHVLVFHHKTHRTAGFAAAEAFVDAFGGGYVEGRRFLIVEGAAGHITGAAALERHKISHHLFYAGGVQDKVYCLLGNHGLFLFKIYLFGVREVGDGDFVVCGGLGDGAVLLRTGRRLVRFFLPEGLGLIPGIPAIPHQAHGAYNDGQDALAGENPAAKRHKEDVFDEPDPTVVIS